MWCKSIIRINEMHIFSMLMFLGARESFGSGISSHDMNEYGHYLLYYMVVV